MSENIYARNELETNVLKQSFFNGRLQRLKANTNRIQFLNLVNNKNVLKRLRTLSAGSPRGAGREKKKAPAPPPPQSGKNRTEHSIDSVNTSSKHDSVPSSSKTSSTSKSSTSSPGSTSSTSTPSSSKLSSTSSISTPKSKAVTPELNNQHDRLASEVNTPCKSLVGEYQELEKVTSTKPELLVVDLDDYDDDMRFSPAKEQALQMLDSAIQEAEDTMALYTDDEETELAISQSSSPSPSPLPTVSPAPSTLSVASPTNSSSTSHSASPVSFAKSGFPSRSNSTAHSGSPIPTQQNSMSPIPNLAVRPTSISPGASRPSTPRSQASLQLPSTPSRSLSPSPAPSPSMDRHSPDGSSNRGSPALNLHHSPTRQPSALDSSGK